MRGLQQRRRERRSADDNRPSPREGQSEVITQQQSYDGVSEASRKDLTALVVELCERHFRLFPDDRFALIWYAMAKIKLAEYSQAEKAIRRSISLRKGDRRFLGIAFKEMGNLSDAKGDLRTSAAWYRRALRANPKRNCYIYLGHIAFRRGLLKQAEAHYRKAIRDPSDCADEACFNLGSVLVARRRYREAIRCYRKALKIDPEYGIAKKRLRDTELALQLKGS